ncbi:hypothetical protein AB5J49_34440 [Streptomyces sp. R28]|uniref:Uncharacterized protein n=1 Tax=Streptomyces sp. R28 TaxID=3238628 RepID=A0AB39Q8Z6_9ACTN
MPGLLETVLGAAGHGGAVCRGLQLFDDVDLGRAGTDLARGSPVRPDGPPRQWTGGLDQGVGPLRIALAERHEMQQ